MLKYLLTGQQTERLSFRLLTLEDFDWWMGLFKAEGVARNLYLDPKLTQTELCQAWFDKVFHRYENGLGGMNVLVDKNTNQPIGQCGLLVQTIDKEERLEIGYSVLPKYWGKGYASEAAIKCKNYGFKNNFADSIISMVHVDNVSSEKVALKNGMSYEKKNGSFNIFSISKETWSQQK